MGWLSGLIGGGLGAMIAGPFGALIGAAIGASLGGGQQVARSGSPGLFNDAQRRQALFFTAAFSMVGKLAKADGRVCDDEIAAIRRISREVMGLDGQTRQYAIAILNQSKVSTQSFADYAAEFGRLFAGQNDLCTFMLSFLFEVAMADGSLHPEEERMLQQAREAFRLPESLYQSLYARFVRHQQPSSVGLARHFETLGVAETASLAEIKKAYRQKASEYHPDKIESKGLPPEFIKFANDKLAEINAAYDAVCKARSS
jgi:DnaJ like chaperone protein